MELGQFAEAKQCYESLHELGEKSSAEIYLKKLAETQEFSFEPAKKETPSFSFGVSSAPSAAPFSFGGGYTFGNNAQANAFAAKPSQS